MKPTFRQLFDQLPEPYRTQGLRNTDDLCPGLLESPAAGSLPGFEFLLDAFPWNASPEGFKYWRAASRGEFQTPPLQLAIGKRYRTRDGRTAGPLVESDDDFLEAGYPFAGPVEGPVEGKLATFTWQTDGAWTRSSNEQDLDLVEEIVEEQPATHRLLEVGEIIQKGDEYLVCGTVDDWRVRQLNIGCPWGTNLSATRRRVLTPEPEPGATPPTNEQRIADLESRVGVLEGLTTTPEPARYPATPLPEGFDRWECRGTCWVIPSSAVWCSRWTEASGKTASWEQEALVGPKGRGWHDGGRADLEYWEAVKDGPPKPPTYRLLNPGEIIRETDEVYIRRGAWVWEAMGEDLATGLPFDPSWQQPMRRLVKSYEDA